MEFCCRNDIDHSISDRSFYIPKIELCHFYITSIERPTSNRYRPDAVLRTGRNFMIWQVILINIRKATGYDNIPAKLLRLAQNELTHPIANLINNTVAMNTFPDQLKCAELSPLFKKEDNFNKTNFRPVSILTGISKLYESVVNDQLFEYFSRLFNDLISAYCKGYSCQSLLVKCIDNW